MKIGFYNIYISLLYFLMLLMTTYAGYVYFKNQVYNYDILKQIIPILILILALLLWGYFFYKFKIIIINKNCILQINPFLFNFKKIDFKMVKTLNYYPWITVKGYYFVCMEIKDFEGNTIIISQALFENFENLVNKIHLNMNIKIPLKMRDLLLKEAESSLGNVIFNLVLLTLFLLFLIGLTFFEEIPFSNFQKIAISINLIVLFATFKRFKNYKLRLKISK